MSFCNRFSISMQSTDIAWVRNDLQSNLAGHWCDSAMFVLECSRIPKLSVCTRLWSDRSILQAKKTELLELQSSFSGSVFFWRATFLVYRDYQFHWQTLNSCPTLSVLHFYFSKRQSNWVSGIWMLALITVPTNWKPNGYIPNRPQHVFTFTFEHRNCGLIQISKPFRENLLEVLRAICYPQQPCAASQIFVPNWSASERKSPTQNEVRGR